LSLRLLLIMILRILLLATLGAFGSLIAHAAELHKDVTLSGTADFGALSNKSTLRTQIGLRAFNAADYGTPRLWLRGSDYVAGKWIAQAGISATQATAGKQPAAGIDFVSFDGTNDSLVCGPALGATDDYTVFAVVRLKAIGTYSSIITSKP